MGKSKSGERHRRHWSRRDHGHELADSDHAPQLLPHLQLQEGAPESGSGQDALLHPALHLHPKLIRNIVELQDQLNPAFNTAVDELILRILQQVAPKNAIDGASVVDGPALAALASTYVDAINIPGACHGKNGPPPNWFVPELIFR